MHSNEKNNKTIEFLDIPFGEDAVGSDTDLVLFARDGDRLSEDTDLTSDLDAILQELLERGDVHDLVLHWLPTVDSERGGFLLALGRASASLGGDSGGHSASAGTKGLKLLWLVEGLTERKREKRRGKSRRTERI